MTQNVKSPVPQGKTGKKKSSPIGQRLGDILEASGMTAPAKKKGADSKEVSPSAEEQELQKKIEKLENEITARKNKFKRVQTENSSFKKDIKLQNIENERLKEEIILLKQGLELAEIEKETLKQLFEKTNSQRKEKLLESTPESDVNSAWREKALAILNNIAVLLYEVELDSEAVTVMEKILVLDPDNQLVRDNLKILQE